MVILCPFLEIEIEEVSWHDSLNYSLQTKYLASNYFSIHSFSLEYGNLRTFILLITWRIEFVLLIKVEPQLESDCRLSKAHGNLRVDYAFSSSHPLDIPRSNDSFVPSEIFMIHFTTEHVSHCFEPSVRMIRESSWQFDIEEIKH